MAFRDLLVQLDDSPICAHRVNAALALARRQKASVTGVALTLEPTISRYIGIDFPANLDREQQDIVRKAAESAIAKFEKAAGEAGVKCSTLRVSRTATAAPAQLAYYARHADLVFMGQPESDKPSAAFQQALLDGVMFDSGRPVYIVPYIGRLTTNERKAVIAWDGGKKAARAVNDAIPILEGRSGEVVVLVINPDARHGAHGENPGSAIAAHLERHGIKAQVVVQHSVSEVSVDAAILNYLSDASADLLIMGAYGHSRLRERAFGGVTHAILEHMTTPVLMSE